MNKKKIIYFPVAMIIWLISSTPGILAQALYDESYNREASNSCEEIIMFTDRNLYTVNEWICFRSFYMKGDALKGITWSQVLYVELVDPSGLAVSSGKYLLDENGSSGSIPIPSDAATGNYFLRSYTRWMRNYGPGIYSYVPIKIINPFKEEIIQLNGNGGTTGNYSQLRMNSEYVTCHTEKDSYLPGEEVSLDLSLPDPGYSIPESFCLTVVPSGSADTISAGFETDPAGHCEEFQFKHLPDIRGISISGMVVTTGDQTPAANSRVHLSLSGNQPDYIGAISDEQGRFILTLPDRTGSYELFTASDPKNGTDHTILVDNDFATDPVPFGSKAFDLRAKEKQVAGRIATNMQLSLAFGTNTRIVHPEIDTGEVVPFYGRPGIRILTKDYIDLPTMTEVIENLLAEVHIQQRRGEKFLRIESMDNTIGFFPPLLLVDNIIIFDLETFLSIDPMKIKKIEVVNEVYVKGNIVFGGIISLTSKKGDMAAVDLPEGSYFFDYQAYHPNTTSSTSIDSQSGDRVPDTRNTLLWIDDLTIEPEETVKMTFPAASHKGTYHILVRGITESGDIVSGTDSFSVDLQ